MQQKKESTYLKKRSIHLLFAKYRKKNRIQLPVVRTSQDHEYHLYKKSNKVFVTCSTSRLTPP